MRKFIVAISAVMVFAFGCTNSVKAQQSPAQDGALALLSQPGYHAIIRHAFAPGTGDPMEVVIGDCTTQRNLSDVGRDQARALGQQLKDVGFQPTKILSSQWCRCLETAELLGLGDVKGYVPINSVWTESGAVSEARAKATIEMLSGLGETESVMMVTHFVNISAITGRSAASGGGFIITVENGDVKVVGDIPAP